MQQQQDESEKEKNEAAAVNNLHSSTPVNTASSPDGAVRAPTNGGPRREFPPFRDFIGTRHVSFFVAFSALLVFSGALFLALSEDRPFAISFVGGPIDIILSILNNRVLFLSIGVLLILSPLYMDQFVFDALDHERRMRVRAQNSTKEAQLLQDILTHDIRNYNQEILLFAERIEEEASGNEKIDQVISTMVGAVGRTTNFVERAKKLGRILSEQQVTYRRTDLAASILRSITLARNQFPDRKILGVVKVESLPIAPVESIDKGKFDPRVLADGMLDEVFSNIFTNSVNNTKSEDEVFIAMELHREYDKQLKKRSWRITIDDIGNGIPDSMKRSLFLRYIDSQDVNARGLGMSIVHALVVGRYGGRIQVRDRVPGEHNRGALIDIWLPAA